MYATPSAGECEAYVPLEAPDIDDPCNEIDRYWNNSPYRTDSTHASGTYPVGTTMFNWYISDVSGNTDSCRVVVIVNDLPPTLTCPDDFTVPADFGQSYATNVAIPLPTHGDNCDYILYWGMHGATTDTSAVFNAIDLVPTPYPQLNVGQTTITYYLLDLNGDIITCDFIITVEAAPVIDCPPDTIHYAGAAGCSFLYNPGIPTLVQGAQPIDWKWTLTNPDGTTLTGSSRTPDDGPNPLPVVAAAPHEYDFQLGTTTIEWTATNISGAEPALAPWWCATPFRPVYFAAVRKLRGSAPLGRLRPGQRQPAGEPYRSEPAESAQPRLPDVYLRRYGARPADPRRQLLRFGQHDHQLAD